MEIDEQYVPEACEKLTWIASVSGVVFIDRVVMNVIRNRCEWER